jgi:hypothetical protein
MVGLEVGRRLRAEGEVYAIVLTAHRAAGRTLRPLDAVRSTTRLIFRRAGSARGSSVRWSGSWPGLPTT